MLFNLGRCYLPTFEEQQGLNHTEVIRTTVNELPHRTIPVISSALISTTAEDWPCLVEELGNV